MDDYSQLLGDIPSAQLDPKELERAKALAMIRAGLGMANREPVGAAIGGGLKAYLGMEQQARQMMLAKLQAYAERQKIEAIATQQAKEKKWLASMTPEQRAKYGITEEVWAAYQGVKDPAEKFISSELTKPYTLQPGQPRVIPGIGVTGQAASPEGYMGVYAPGSAEQLGRYVVPGAPEAATEIAKAQEYGKGLGQAATQIENVPVRGGRPGQTEPVIRSQLLGELAQPAAPAAPAAAVPPAAAPATAPSKTALAAQKILGTLQPELRDESNLLAEAIAQGDKEGIRKHENNIKAIQESMAPWQKYAPATPTGVAPAPTEGRRIADPVAVKEAEAKISKTPEGFQWKDGVLQRVPGGPEDTSILEATTFARWTERADSLLKTISEALPAVGFSTAGVGGSIGLKLPGSPATDLAKKLAMVKANIGFQELNAMREVSKTGGALGQVAIQELNFLQTSLGSLDQDQSPAQLRKTLEEVAKHYNKQKALMQEIAAAKQKQAGAGAQSFGKADNDPLGLRGGR